MRLIAAGKSITLTRQDRTKLHASHQAWVPENHGSHHEVMPQSASKKTSGRLCHHPTPYPLAAVAGELLSSSFSSLFRLRQECKHRQCKPTGNLPQIIWTNNMTEQTPKTPHANSCHRAVKHTACRRKEHRGNNNHSTQLRKHTRSRLTHEQICTEVSFSTCGR